MGCSYIDYLRMPRVLDMAIFDWASSLLFAFLVGHFVLRLSTALQWSVWLVSWTAFGVAVHWVIGVPTMFGYYLGLNARPTRKECKSMIE